MNFLITGSTGFLGNYISEYLTDKNHKVLKCTRNKLKNDEFYFDLKNGYELNKKNKLILKNVNILIHCAFNFDCKNYSEHLKINFEGSKKIFELAKLFNIKIIYISSISAFEKSVALYGKIKFAIEGLAKQYQATILRPGIIYGISSQSIFGVIEKVILRFPIIPLIGFGNQKLYTCKIDNLCLLIEHLSKLNNNRSIIITAASKKWILFKHMIKIIANKNKKKIILLPFPSALIYLILYLNSLFRIIKRLKSDNLTSILNCNNDPSFEELDKTNIIFSNFETDY